jgi:hypothetical protein
MKLTRTFAIHFIASLFIFLFTYTALSKFLDFTNFRAVLGASPLIGNNAGWLAWLLPSAELVTSVLLFFPKTRLPGLYTTFLLMSIFTVYIGAMLLLASHLPCSCGGVVSRLTWKQHFWLNIFLVSVAGAGIRLYRLHYKPQPNYLLQ